MECRRHGLALAHQHRIVALAGQHLHAAADLFYLGSADENHLQRCAVELALTDRTLYLAAISIAPHLNIKRTQAALRGSSDFFGQQNGAGASTEGGLGANEIGQLLEESVLF